MKGIFTPQNMMPYAGGRSVKKWTYLTVGLLIAAGLGVLFYPTISSVYNAKFQATAVTGYKNTMSARSAETLQSERTMAEKYNAALTGRGIEDPFIPGSGMALPDNYLTVLDMQDGIMGSLSIPTIDVELSIYHGTDDEVLQKGVGHMNMTAFPIGGNGNHSALTGHTGQPNAKLFTELNKLEKGDLFFIEILNETLAYEIDQIITVSPTDTAELKPVAGKDYITLITCTPYAINSHRLLVRGARVSYRPEQVLQMKTERKTEGIVTYDFIIAVSIAFAVTSLLAGLFVGRYCKRRKAKRGKE